VNVYLRDVEASDLALFFEHQRDPIAVEMVMFRSRDKAEFAQHWAKLLADHSCLKKTIIVASAVSAENDVSPAAPAENDVASAVSAENGVGSAVSAEYQVVGHIGSWTSEGKREIGYWLDRAFWGRGIATKAISDFLLLEPTRPLYASVAKHNAASIRVLQKCGFVIDDAPSEDDGPTHILLKLAAQM
jgi:RimJ/RimL family protein N-acetyltransferase